MLQKCIVYKKIIKCQRNLFSLKLQALKWRHNPSQSPRFVPHRKWNFMFLVQQNTGKENSYRLFFCYSYQYIVEILSSKQKKWTVIYTLNRFFYRKFLTSISTCYQFKFLWTLNFNVLLINTLFWSILDAMTSRTEKAWEIQPENQLGHTLIEVSTGGPDVVCDLHTWQYCITFEPFKRMYENGSKITLNSTCSKGFK